MIKENMGKLKFLIAPLFVSVLMLYCYMSIPLCFDQFVGAEMVKKQGGLLAYVLGYCTYWVRNVNGRLTSAIVSGIIENNTFVYKIISALLVFLIFALATRALNVKKNRTMSTILWCVIFLSASRGIQNEVYFYANTLFLGVVLLTEVLLIFVKQIMYYSNDSINIKTAVLYLLVVFISSFWLETFSASLFVVSVCLVVWDVHYTKRINVWNVSASAISLAGLIVMGYHRRKTVLSVVHVRDIVNKIELVVNDVFKGNAGITFLLALILILSVVFSHKTIFKNKICKTLMLGFWIYIMITSFCYYYNGVIVALSSPLEASESFIPPVLKTISFPAFLPLGNIHLQTGIYIVFLLTILFRVARTDNNLYNLYTLGIGAVSVGTIFFTGEFYGARIITPGVLLIALSCVGVSDEIDNIRCKEILIIGLIIMLLLLCDRYYTRYSIVNEIKEHNERMISQTIERQLNGTWNYETDVMWVKTYRDLLFYANPMEGEVHFPYYCEVYGLDLRTHVQCY